MPVAAPAVCMKPTSITTQSWKARISNRIWIHTLQFISPKPGSRGKEIIGPKSKVETVRLRAGSGEGGARAVTDGFSYFSANGLKFTLNNLSKWIGAASFTLVLLLRHDAEALWAATGSLLNACLGSLLKKTLNQERPVPHLRSDPGMPSSHAQSLFYIVAFFVLSLVQWQGLNGVTTFLSGLSIGAAAYFAWLRVSQQLHTVPQVLAGAILGTFFSILWFWSWDAMVLKAFISHIWVRVLVLLGGATFCVSFMLYIIRYWAAKPVILYTSRKLQIGL